MRNPQLNAEGALKHLLTLEGLPAEVILHILDTAEPFVSVAEREVKKVPLLRGKAIFNLFFESSTRTRTTFEIAAKRLSADVINLNIGVSSTSKGETLLDTVDNLCAMNADMFVVRHSQSGAPHLIAAHLDATGRQDVHVINAGDVERQRCALRIRLESRCCIVVAVERNVDVAHRVIAGNRHGEAIGQPRAARVDADECGVVRHCAAQAGDERVEQRFGVGNLRRHAAREARPRGSCARRAGREARDFRGRPFPRPRVRFWQVRS